jgi:hypothetical protein
MPSNLPLRLKSPPTVSHLPRTTTVVVEPEKEKEEEVTKLDLS